jgi:hypothetical protein
MRPGRRQPGSHGLASLQRHRRHASAGPSAGRRIGAAILDEPIPPEFSEEELGEAYAQPRCPRCYSLDIGFEKIDRFWTFGLWLLLQFPVPIRKNCWKCYTCGIEWVEE